VIVKIHWSHKNTRAGKKSLGGKKEYGERITMSRGGPHMGAWGGAKKGYKRDLGIKSLNSGGLKGGGSSVFVRKRVRYEVGFGNHFFGGMREKCLVGGTFTWSSIGGVI